jgi:hypothetical protein
VAVAAEEDLTAVVAVEEEDNSFCKPIHNHLKFNQNEKNIIPFYNRTIF